MELLNARETKLPFTTRIAHYSPRTTDTTLYFFFYIIKRSLCWSVSGGVLFTRATTTRQQQRQHANGIGASSQSPTPSNASSVLGNVQGKCRAFEIGTERDGDGEKRATRERRERRESGEREEVGKKKKKKKKRRSSERRAFFFFVVFGNDTHWRARRGAFLPLFSKGNFGQKKKKSDFRFDDDIFFSLLLRRAHLNEIANYDGGDPLEVWLRYARILYRPPRSI